MHSQPDFVSDRFVTLIELRYNHNGTVSLKTEPCVTVSPVHAAGVVPVYVVLSDLYQPHESRTLAELFGAARAIPLHTGM